MRTNWDFTTHRTPDGERAAYGALLVVNHERMAELDISLSMVTPMAELEEQGVFGRVAQALLLPPGIIIHGIFVEYFLLNLWHVLIEGKGLPEVRQSERFQPMEAIYYHPPHAGEPKVLKELRPYVMGRRITYDPAYSSSVGYRGY